MEILLCYVIIYLIEALILWLYCNDLFIPKRTIRQTIVSLFALYGLLFFLSLFDNYILNSSAFLIANFIFIYLFYHVKWASALFHAGITTVAMFFGEVLLFAFLPDFARNFYEARSDISFFILCVFFNKLIYFFILYILSHIFNMQKIKKGTDTKGTLLLTFVPSISFYLLVTLATVYHTAEISTSLRKMIAVCAILLLLLNFLIWFFFSYTQKRNQDFVDLQLSLLRENDTAEYYKMLSTQNENRNILVHNIRGHLYAIAALAEQKQPAEIIDYINDLTQTSSLQNSDTLQLCKNNTLNAILCRYKEECKEQKIDFRTDIRNEGIDFMSANDLTALFCNLLDNAMEAATGISNAFIELRITRQENKPYTVLSVQNSCSENPFDSRGKLVSHKKDNARHGLGLKSIQRTIESYGGDMHIYYEETTGTFHTVIQIKGLQ